MIFNYFFSPASVYTAEILYLNVGVRRPSAIRLPSVNLSFFLKATYLSYLQTILFTIFSFQISIRFH